MEEIGRVRHYYDKIGVAAVKLTKSLKVGDKIKVQGNTTDFEQVVESMQIQHDQVTRASKGSEVGLKVSDKVKTNDKVYCI